MRARLLRAIGAALLLLPVLGACGYTATCTFENHTDVRVNVYQAYAGADGVPQRAPGLVRDLDPHRIGQGACGASGDGDYSIYFEARAFGAPAGRPGEAAGDLIWSEVISRQELARRDMRVVIEDRRGGRSGSSPASPSPSPSVSR